MSERSTNIEWNVQRRVTDGHFEKLIVGNGHTSDPEANTLTVKFQGHSGH